MADSDNLQGLDGGQWATDAIGNAQKLNGWLRAFRTSIANAANTILTTRGDLLTRSASALVRLAVGGANTVLKSDGTDPAWGQVHTAMIADDAVTFAKMQNIATSRLLGRSTAGSGDTEEITPSDGLSLASGLLKAKVLQEVYAEDGATASGTTTIPSDDTIPQNTEGTEFMTVAVTPISASSTLFMLVTVIYTVSISTNDVIWALFKDTDADSFAAWCLDSSIAKQVRTFAIRVASGNTTARTYKLRGGPSSASTLYFNSDAGTRKLGGVAKSTIRIIEIL